MKTRSLSLVLLSALGIVACGPSSEHARTDSASARLAERQAKLTLQLAAQKDSLTRVVLEADDFIMRLDSSVSRVKGLPKSKRKEGGQLDPLAQQIENRKTMLARVDGLVARAQATAAQLAKSQHANSALRKQLAADSAMIVDLNTTIGRQTAMIDALTLRVDSLKGVTQELGKSLANLDTVHNKAFYLVGREDDLVKRGVIVREGGANLLFAHPGRTLQMARTVDPNLFTAVDQRGAHMIAMPDSTHRYKVISRQSLDYAVVEGRDKDSFKGNLKIKEPSRFWAPSRYLVVVEQ
jgi:hypothetical protein